MSLANLNNSEPAPVQGLLQSFWEDDNHHSRSSSPAFLGSGLSDAGNESSTSLNEALSRTSVASNSSASFDSSNDQQQERQATNEDTFVVPTAPASFKVGPGPRLTSTGKVSHARKVPVNHIKRFVVRTLL